MVRRTAVAFLIGGLAGAILCAGGFLILSTIDGTRLNEALAYSLVVAVLGGGLGGIIGGVVGLGNMRVIGGALVGLVMSLLIVAFYISGIAGEGTLIDLLNRSRVIIVLLTVPLILTGMVAAAGTKAFNERD